MSTLEQQLIAAIEDLKALAEKHATRRLIRDEERADQCERDVAQANAQAREWKLLFLRAIGETNPWAVSTWHLADAERFLARVKDDTPTQSER